MRAIAALVLLGTIAAPIALAQQLTPIVIPPAPPIVATPATPPATAPDLVQTPVPPDNADTGAAAPPPENATPGGPVPAAGADADIGSPLVPPAPPAWLPAPTAELGVLNEVDGSVTQVQIPVGGQAKIGDLQIGVTACLRRPPDQIPDAAVFITAAAPAAGNQAQGAPTYSGWVLRSAPGAAVVGDASETFRVIDCS